MQKIEDLREDLLRNYKEWFQLIQERKNIVFKITKYKENNGLSSYDKKQEERLSDKLSEQLKGLNSKELLSLSLLIEAHVDSEDYPKWSELGSCVESMTNPVLK